MRPSSTLIAAALALSQCVPAHPGLEKTLAAIRARADGGDDGGDSSELIGDLVAKPDRELSQVGTAVKGILLGNTNAESTEQAVWVPPKGSQACAQDTCCIWKHVANTMESAFRGPSGRCTNLARAAVRLGFHDAAGWSKATAPGGGADGSIVLAAEEMARPANNGLQEIVGQMRLWHGQYKAYGVGMADLVQMAANVATVVCPLGPRIRSFVGRADSSVACPDHLLPDVHAAADSLIELFGNKTVRPHGLTALIGAHTTSQQRFVDPSRAGDPQDSTPGVWDVKFYSETLGPAPPRVFKLQSDVVLSQHPQVADEFRQFAGPGGQQHWNSDYAREYVRVSLLGVYNINDLVECSKVLPRRSGSVFRAPDQGAMDKWLSSAKKIPEVANALLDGKSIGDLLSRIIALLGGKRR